MSWDTLAWARRVRAGSPAKKALLMVLAEYADEADSCFPSQALLADATEQSVRTVRAQLAQLEADGLLRREPRRRADGGRTSDRYYLLVTTTAEATPPAEPAGPPGNLTREPPGNQLPGPPGNLLPPNSQVEQPPEPPPEPRAQLALVAPEANSAAGAVAFDAFWRAYPRKTDKGAARRAWSAAAKKADPEHIVAGARRYAADPNRDDRFTKHAATWLNAEAWDNPPLPPRTGQTGRTIAPPTQQRDLPQGRIQLP